MEANTNPFPGTTGSTDASFLLREKAIESLNVGLKTHQTVLLTGRKGCGKTTLTRLWKGSIASGKGGVLMADCYPSMSEQEWIRSLTVQLLHGIDTSQVKVMRELASSLTFMQPVVRYEAFSGKAVLDFNLDPGYKPLLCLEQLLTYIERTWSPKAILLDGVQQLASFKSSNPLLYFLQALKGFPKLPVVFCAEDGQLLNKILDSDLFGESTSSPMKLRLENPEEDELADYINRGFAGGKRKISQSAIEHLLDWSRMDLSACVSVAHRLFASGMRAIDEWELQDVLRQMLNERKGFYFTYRDLLTDNQWVLLRGIARERGARLVMGAEFIRKNNLGTPSSVQTAMAALQEKSLIYEEEGKWWLTDVMFSRWLEEAG